MESFARSRASEKRCSAICCAAELSDLDGCYLYVVSRAPDDPDGIWVYEVWRSEADHRASLEHPAVQSLIASARPIIAEMPLRIEMTPVGGKGLPDGAT